MLSPRDELVRIDSHGVAHPIGTVASQRMRHHEGAYRLLPSPEHVVFMRFTGEDGRVDEGDGAIVRLAGEIVVPGTICDIFALLAQTGWRGVLVIQSGSITRKVFLDQGNVLGAKSNDLEERLGRVMYRYGHVSEADLDLVDLEMKAGRRFGEVALEKGIIAADRLYQGFLQQITEVVVGAMHVGDGTFFFLDHFDESELPTRQAVSINSLLMDGVTRLDEMKYFEEKIPSVEHVPARLQYSEPPGELYLPIFELVDGTRNIRDLGRQTGLGEFETMKKLFGLVQSKHVTIHPPKMNGGPAAIASAANDILIVCTRRARKAGLERELRQSLDAFAVGAGVFYDMLFRGAGPDSAGRYDPERIAENAAILASEGDVEQNLRKLLLEYASFALFSLGAALGKEKEAELQRECDLALQSLRPTN